MPAEPLPVYLDTPKGLFATAGVWFATTESLLQTYAHAVFTHVPLDTLIERTVAWLRSGQTVLYWGIPLAVFLFPDVPAVIGLLAVFLLWELFAPAWGSVGLTRIFRVLQKDTLQYGYYIVALSWLGMHSQYVALAISFAGFILIRWRLLERATAILLAPFWKRLYPLPIADQVLRHFIHRAALRHRVPLGELADLETAVLNQISRLSARLRKK